MHANQALFLALAVYCLQLTAMGWQTTISKDLLSSHNVKHSTNREYVKKINHNNQLYVACVKFGEKLTDGKCFVYFTSKEKACYLCNSTDVEHLLNKSNQSEEVIYYALPNKVKIDQTITTASRKIRLGISSDVPKSAIRVDQFNDYFGNRQLTIEFTPYMKNVLTSFGMKRELILDIASSLQDFNAFTGGTVNCHNETWEDDMSFFFDTNCMNDQLLSQENSDGMIVNGCNNNDDDHNTLPCYHCNLHNMTLQYPFFMPNNQTSSDDNKNHNDNDDFEAKLRAWEIEIENEDMVNNNDGSMNAIEVSNISRSIEFMQCFMALVQQLSLDDRILRISLTTKPTLTNYFTRGIVQTGIPTVEPYTTTTTTSTLSSFGLTGKGQICGIADSGLSDTSCFFIDDDDNYNKGLSATRTTNRSGDIEEYRRKVIQYYPFADSIDNEGEHGTHVCGTITGSSIRKEFTSMNGVAPDAKIAFFDIGISNVPFLKVPPLSFMFAKAYKAGARIHSNSWGNIGGMYGLISHDVDSFTYEHDDMLIIYAGGNEGRFGSKSIISPGNAKNVLTVGAGQTRSARFDNLQILENYTIAPFSSIGPTFDGRIKPDIIAPGDPTMSAFASSVAQSLSSLSTDWKGADICAVHQLSGTSMATPVIAGVALLLRQYFMDSNFWSKYCNSQYKSCQSGAFTPSGYLMKALILHSGQEILRYSDPIYNVQTTFNSFEIITGDNNDDNSAPDNFQGYGGVLLSNVIPLKQVYQKQQDVLAHKKKNTTSNNDEFVDDFIGSNYDNKNRNNNNTTLLNSGDHYNSKWMRHKDFDLIVFDKVKIYENQLMNVEIDMMSNKSTTTDEKNFVVDENTTNNCNYHNKFIKVTLCWYDPPSSVGFSEKLLLHDIDLFVVGPNNEIFFGNKPSILNTKLNNTNDIYDLLQTKSDDRNPNEQIVLFNITFYCRHQVTACLFKIYIKSYSFYESDYQNISLVITTNGVVTKELETVNEVVLEDNSVLNNNNIPFLPVDNKIIKISALDDEVATTKPISVTSDILDTSKLTQSNNINKHSLVIPNVSLGISIVNGNFVNDKVCLEKFNFTGSLNSIFISLDAYNKEGVQTRGSNEFLLTVIVHGPNGITAQVGGFDYYSVQDRFYSRKWPELWLGMVSFGYNWESKRNMQPAGLSSIDNNGERSNEWIVEVAMGFSYGFIPISFSGEITLYFDTSLTNSDNVKEELMLEESKESIDLIDNDETPSNNYNNNEEEGEENNNNDKKVVVHGKTVDKSIVSDRRFAVVSGFVMIMVVALLAYVACQVDQKDSVEERESLRNGKTKVEINITQKGRMDAIEMLSLLHNNRYQEQEEDHHGYGSIV